MVLAFITVAHFAQADSAVVGTCQTIKRMIGDIEFHDAAAQFRQPVRLCADFHPLRHRRCAGGRRSFAAAYLNETEAAGTEGFQHVGGAQLRNRNADLVGRAHDAGAFLDLDIESVDLQRDLFIGFRFRGAVIGFFQEGHLAFSYSAACLAGFTPKSSGKCFKAL